MYLINSYRYGGVVVDYLYDDVSAMYTLRQPIMTTLWTNAVLTLRRSSDNAETSVFFDTNGKISLTSLVSAGGSLGTWIGANNAFVKEWFALTPDNIIDTNKKLIQTTTSKQPQFISGGVILAKNGESTIDFLSDLRYLESNANSDLDSGNDFTVLSVTSNTVSGGSGTIFTTRDAGGGTQSKYRLFNDNSTNKRVSSIRSDTPTTFFSLYNNQENTTNQKLITSITTTSDIIPYYNGAIQTSVGWDNNGYLNDIIRVGNESENALSQKLNGTIQEILIYPSDKTSGLAAIDTDIMDYYYINKIIADYPLANDSNETVGRTSGIDGTDTDITYDGTEATFNGTTSIIVLPDNDIFSFTDGANDLPFSIEFEVNLDSIDGTNGVWFINKRDVGTSGDIEWQIGYNNGVLFVSLFDANDGSINIQRQYTFGFPLNTDVKIKCTYDGNKLASGIKLFVNDVSVGNEVSNGNYQGMTNTNSTVVVGKRGWANYAYLDGTMKNLKFYNYEKLT
jgi:hypothetical protein